MEEQLTTRTEFKHEVQFGFSLECECKLDNERMLHVFEDGSLGDGVLNLILLDEMLLLKGLDSIDIPIIDLLRQEHLAVGTGADDLHQLKFIDREGTVRDL